VDAAAPMAWTLEDIAATAQSLVSDCTQTSKQKRRPQNET